MGAAHEANEISLLDRVKIQAEVLVPLLHRLRTELGTAPANALVAEVLRDWQRSVHERIAAEMPGEGFEKLGAMMAAKMPLVRDAITVEWGTVDPPKLMEFKVTRCAFADFFREIGEPELGALLACEGDLYDVAAAGGGVELQRSATIMHGAAACDFRYRKTTPEDP